MYMPTGGGGAGYGDIGGSYPPGPGYGNNAGPYLSGDGGVNVYPGPGGDPGVNSFSGVGGGDGRVPSGGGYSPVGNGHMDHQSGGMVGNSMPLGHMSQTMHGGPSHMGMGYAGPGPHLDGSSGMVGQMSHGCGPQPGQYQQNAYMHQVPRGGGGGGDFGMHVGPGYPESRSGGGGHGCWPGPGYQDGPCCGNPGPCIGGGKPGKGGRGGRRGGGPCGFDGHGPPYRPGPGCGYGPNGCGGGCGCCGGCSDFGCCGSGFDGPGGAFGGGPNPGFDMGGPCRGGKGGGMMGPGGPKGGPRRNDERLRDSKGGFSGLQELVPGKGPPRGGFRDDDFPAGPPMPGPRQRGGKGEDGPLGKGALHSQSSQYQHSNLFIGSLAPDTTDAKVRDALSNCGTVVACRTFSRNGRTCALVKMSNVAEAEQACKFGAARAFGTRSRRWMVKFVDSDMGSGGGGEKGGSGPKFEKLGGGGKMGFDGGKASGQAQGGGDGDGLPLGKGGVSPFLFGGKAPPRPMVRPQTVKGGGEDGFSGEPAPPPVAWREPKQDYPASENLYVKGLPPRTNESHLTHAFSAAGKVVELKILRYGDSYECAALVRMDTTEAAEKAISTLSGTILDAALPPLSLCYHGQNPTTASDNVYVKGLPLTITEDQLYSVFKQAGAIKRCRVLQNVKNFTALDSAALVQMESVAEAGKAIEMLNGTVLTTLGPTMVIRFANPKPATSTSTTPSDNLYVKGLPLGTPEILLKAVFAQFGTVVRLKVLTPRNNEAYDCAALVQMSSVEEAKSAVEGLHGRVLEGPMPCMRVRFQGKDRSQEPSCNLYVAGLPTTILETQLRATFASCGTVVRTRLLLDPMKPETHALVQMGTIEEAQAAIDKLHNQQPESVGPTLTVKFAAKKPKKESGDGAIPELAPPAPGVTAPAPVAAQAAPPAPLAAPPAPLPPAAVVGAAPAPMPPSTMQGAMPAPVPPSTLQQAPPAPVPPPSTLYAEAPVLEAAGPSIPEPMMETEEVVPDKGLIAGAVASVPLPNQDTPDDDVQV